MSFYEKEEPHDFAAMITEEQKSRLSSALFRSTTISSEDFCLINLLKDDEGERLVVFILRYLKNVVNDPPYYTDQLMAFISDKLGNKEALELTREFSDLDLLDDKEGKQRKRMLSDFIALIERRMTA